MSENSSLTIEELGLIQESLRYTKKAFEEYGGFPNYEFKQQQIAAVDMALRKVIEMKRALKKQVKVK